MPGPHATGGTPAQPGPPQRPAPPGSPAQRRPDRAQPPATRSQPPGPPTQRATGDHPAPTRPPGPRSGGDQAGPLRPPGRPTDPAPRGDSDPPPGRVPARPPTEGRAAVPPPPVEPARDAPRKPPPNNRRSAPAAEPEPTTALSQPPDAEHGAPQPDTGRAAKRSRQSRSTLGRRNKGAAAAVDENATDVLPPLDDDDATRIGGRTDTGGWPTSGPAEPAAIGKPKPRAAPRTRREKRLRLAARAGVAFLSVLALLITGGGWSYLRATGNSFTQVSALAENEDDVIDSQAQLGDENYLIVGTDTRAGDNAEVGAGTVADAEGARADTTMLVHIPKNRQRVVIVSFPRDLDVTRPECVMWDNEKPGYTDEIIPAATSDKLNAVYARGGPECLVKTIQRLTGSTINHFIGIDFAGFEQMVDKVDGVEVCVSKPLEDELLGTILPTAGRHRINGATALAYVRARHVYGEERSDYDRINRQQKFLASLLRGALSSKMLLDPGRLNGFIQAFSKATFVDRVEPNDLLMLGKSLQDLESGAVTFLTVPTAGTTSYGNEIPRTSDIQAIFQAIRDDQPLPGEKTAPAPPPTSEAPVPPSLTAVDPSTLSLLVSNGSGLSGLASSTASELAGVGFSIYNVGNYTEGNAAETKVRYSTGHEAEAATVASAIPGATMEVDDSLNSIVELVLGEDYQQIVNEPTPVGSLITDVPPASTEPVELPSDLEHVNAADDPCAAP
ncbi:LCP family protein [Nocardia flavorosea]|uniref:LCP family protein n=1 Tax=Nocardia flavorosea TaxID=53429 RepID=UPI002B4AD962|nr:LCP family protein [Nocardia flavorosea]